MSFSDPLVCSGISGRRARSSNSRLVGVQPREQTVEGDEAGRAREDAVEARPQSGLALLGWMPAIGLEIAIEPPDQAADAALGCAVLVGEGVELVNEALGMDPAQAVLADIELAGIVADDDGVGQKAVRLDAAPQRALGGDPDRIGIDLERRDAELLEMRAPGRSIGEDAGRDVRPGGRSPGAASARWRI